MKSFTFCQKIRGEKKLNSSKDCRKREFCHKSAEIMHISFKKKSQKKNSFKYYGKKKKKFSQRASKKYITLIGSGRGYPHPLSAVIFQKIYKFQVGGGGLNSEPLLRVLSIIHWKKIKNFFNLLFKKRLQILSAGDKYHKIRPLVNDKIIKFCQYDIDFTWLLLLLSPNNNKCPNILINWWLKKDCRIC